MIALFLIDDLIDVIVDAFNQMARYVEAGVVYCINALVAAIGAFIGVMLALLPDMPNAPSLAGDNWLGWLNWLLPVAPIIAGLTVFVSVWAVYLLCRIPLKWVKAL